MKLIKLGDALKRENPVRELYLECCDHWDEDKQGLSKEAMNLFLVELLDLEVLNGGFVQFFINSSRYCVPETLEALSALSAPLSLELLKRAVAFFPPNLSPDERRQFIIDNDLIDAPTFDELDEVYYEQVSSFPDTPSVTENLWHLALQYIELHKDVSVLREPPQTPLTDNTT